MRLTIVLDLDNAAFGDTRHERGSEAASILDDYIRHIDYDGLDIGDGGVLRDTSGNTVGRWEVMDQPQSCDRAAHQIQTDQPGGNYQLPQQGEKQ